MGEAVMIAREDVFRTLFVRMGFAYMTEASIAPFLMGRQTAMHILIAEKVVVVFHGILNARMDIVYMDLKISKGLTGLFSKRINLFFYMWKYEFNKGILC